MCQRKLVQRKACPKIAPCAMNAEHAGAKQGGGAPASQIISKAMMLRPKHKLDLFTIATQLRTVFETPLISETGLSRATKAIVSPVVWLWFSTEMTSIAVKNKRQLYAYIKG